MEQRSKIDPLTQLLVFLESTSNCITYLHVTDEEKNAKLIMQKGFNYVDNFYKTVDRISPLTDVTLSWVHIQRKPYGNYTMIIQIDKNVMNIFSGDIEGLSFNPHQNSNREDAFTLYKHYVKGYFDSKTGIIVKNPEFNPKFNPSQLKR